MVSISLLTSLIIAAISLPFQLLSQTAVSVVLGGIDELSFDATLYELFYCTLNTTGESETVYLEAQVSKDGEDILIARSGTFLLEEGITTINSFNAASILQSISNVSTEYLEEDIYDQIVQTGYIPSGNYMFCLIVYSLTDEPLSNPDVCHSFMSWPISPPRLILPNDNTEIETEEESPPRRPQIIPASPSSRLSRADHFAKFAVVSRSPIDDTLMDAVESPVSGPEPSK